MGRVDFQALSVSNGYNSHTESIETSTHINLGSFWFQAFITPIAATMLARAMKSIYILCKKRPKAAFYASHLADNGLGPPGPTATGVAFAYVLSILIVRGLFCDRVL